jgi:hypothetical protein
MFPSEIASTGHSSMQVPHAVQSSLILYAILFKVYMNKKNSAAKLKPSPDLQNQS